MLKAKLGEQLGEGGEGIVYALPDCDQFLAAYRLKIGTVHGKGPFVFKHYHSDPDWQRVVRLVKWLEERAWSVRNEISDTTTWPLVLVTDPKPDNSPSPGSSGIVMRRLDDEFFMTLQTMGRSARRYRVVDYLSWNTTQAAQVAGFEFPSLQQRLNILASIARTFTLLHTHDLHYGDINPNNIVLGPNWNQPRIMLVDCDSIRTGHTNEGPPLNAPGWGPPEGGASNATDCYKFTLLIARTLGCSTDQAALVAAASGQRLGISHQLNNMLLAGLNTSPSQRPTMAELGKALAYEATNTATRTLPSELPAPPPTQRTQTVKPPRPKQPHTQQPPTRQPPQPPPTPYRPTPHTPPGGPQQHPPRTPQPQQPNPSRLDSIRYRWRQFVRGVRIALLVLLVIVIGSTVYNLVNQDNQDTGYASTDGTTTGSSGSFDSTPTPPVSDPADSAFAPHDSMDGKYVAVLWSGLEDNPRSDAATQLLKTQLAEFRAQFGDAVVGLDGNEFRSLRDGSIAVAFPGSFNSAREAADWCISAGLNTNLDCFGVVLSDDHDFEERGDDIRVYPKQQ